MKFVIALCLMMFAVATMVAKPQYYTRSWTRSTSSCPQPDRCPVGTHSSIRRCGGINPSAPTCRSPQVYDLGRGCDMSRMSRCDCDPPTLLDETTGKCVQPEDCPRPPPSPCNCNMTTEYLD